MQQDSRSHCLPRLFLSHWEKESKWNQTEGGRWKRFFFFPFCFCQLAKNEGMKQEKAWFFSFANQSAPNVRTAFAEEKLTPCLWDCCYLEPFPKEMWTRVLCFTTYSVTWWKKKKALSSKKFKHSLLRKISTLKKKKKKKKETTTFCWNKTHFEAGKSGRLMLLIQENQTFLFIVLSTYPSLIVLVNFAGFVIERGKNHHGHGSQFKSSQFGISFSFPFFRSFFFLLLWHEKQATSWGEPEAYCGAGHCWLDERRIQVTFLIELFCVRFSALHSLSSVARDNRWGWNSFSAILPCPDEQY